MMTTLARITLALMMLTVVALSIRHHGKTVRSFRFHAFWPVVAVINEAVLILFAGGWGL